MTIKSRSERRGQSSYMFTFR